MRNKIIFVTGGLGFIGKHFVKTCLDLDNYVINIDMVSYASDRVAMQDFNENTKYQFTKARVEQLEYLPPCDLVVNFAAESHVDASISNTSKAFQHNIHSVYRLLELLREKTASDRPRLIHISTDEVYGDILSGSSLETDTLRPSNPYASTKAAGDMMIHAWGRTYNMDYNIVRMTNVYGHHQHPEKLIPKTCMRVSRGLPATIHGTGEYVRTWLHTEDAIRGILTVIDKGATQEIYNIGGNTELSVLQVVEKIGKFYNNSAIEFTANRPGQDVRYSLDYSKIAQLGWLPEKDFDSSLTDIMTEHNYARFIQPWSKSSYVKLVI